jgi:hypothetical protein
VCREGRRLVEYDLIVKERSTTGRACQEAPCRSSHPTEIPLIDSLYNLSTNRPVSNFYLTLLLKYHTLAICEVVLQGNIGSSVFSGWCLCLFCLQAKDVSLQPLLGGAAHRLTPPTIVTGLTITIHRVPVHAIIVSTWSRATRARFSGRATSFPHHDHQSLKSRSWRRCSLPRHSVLLVHGANVRGTLSAPPDRFLVPSISITFPSFVNLTLL